jgi:hypothetical protein
LGKSVQDFSKAASEKDRESQEESAEVLHFQMEANWWNLEPLAGIEPAKPQCGCFKPYFRPYFTGLRPMWQAAPSMLAHCSFIARLLNISLKLSRSFLSRKTRKVVVGRDT